MITEKFNVVVQDAIAYIGLGIVIAIVIFLLLLSGVLLIGKCKLFSKCGKKWWKAIIPFYDNYVFIVEICELHWAWFVLTLLIDMSFIKVSTLSSLLMMFVMAMCFYNLAIKGNRDNIAAMIFGGVFAPIMYAVYGFGNYEYHKEIPVKQSGLF